MPFVPEDDYVLVVWTDEEKLSAKEMVSAWCDRLYDIGISEGDILSLTKKYTDTIGSTDTSFDKWCDRFISASEDKTNKLTGKTVIRPVSKNRLRHDL